MVTRVCVESLGALTCKVTGTAYDAIVAPTGATVPAPLPDPSAAAMSETVSESASGVPPDVPSTRATLVSPKGSPAPGAVKPQAAAEEPRARAVEDTIGAVRLAVESNQVTGGSSGMGGARDVDIVVPNRRNTALCWFEVDHEPDAPELEYTGPV